jgi:micrococcal nuclease
MRKYLFMVPLAVILLFVGTIPEARKTVQIPDSPSDSTHLAVGQPSGEKPIKVAPASPVVNSNQLYEVVKVIDGDTIDIRINDKIERLRLIGINTPETVDPRKPVECFGKQASEKARALLDGKQVSIESDSTQGERDKYNRLLRYVFLEDGTNLNLLMIREGYAYEYTYDLPYKYQNEFKQAQKYAEENELGLWNTCEKLDGGQTSVNLVGADACVIKGNISSKKEKIYHAPGCGSYDKTVINESAGEKWFCSEQEALDAGWRKALNC